MQLLHPLVTGFAEAPGGYAQIYRRGTSTKATCYTDFLGHVSTTSHPLGSTGRVVRYVNELVDVSVFDASGNPVSDPFTFGNGAPALEIKHNHLTGNDYDTGQAALGFPLTFQTFLDTLYTSFGADDLKVPVSGAATLLKDAIAQFAISGVYNVKSSTYGALGNGTQDDTAKIQSAIAAAAAAGGGTVLLPPGDFRITAPLDFTIANGALVSLVGMGAGVSFLSLDHATNNWVTLPNGGPTSGWQHFTGIRFRSLQANTGAHLRDAAGGWTRGLVSRCAFEGCGGRGINIVNGNQILIESCLFAPVSASSNTAAIFAATAGAGPVRVENCIFTMQAGASNSNGIVRVSTAGGLHLSGCYFDASLATGTYFLVDPGSGPTVPSIVRGNRYNLGSATATFLAANTTTAPNIEDHNVRESASGLLYASSANLGTGFCGSRMERTEAATNQTVPVTVTPNLKEFGEYHVPVTAGGAATLTITPTDYGLPDRGRWTLTVKNTGGGNVTIAFTNGGGFTWRAAAVVPINGSAATFEFMRIGTEIIQLGAAFTG